MGYTHYWNFKRKPIDIKDGAQKFKTAVELLREGISRLPKELPNNCWKQKENGEWGTVQDGTLPLTLHNGIGEGEPILKDDHVCFNGDAALGYDHETCSFVLDDADYKFNFCKTARKPYDVAVCLALLCFFEAFGDDFSYSSDGDIENGEEGWKLAKEIMSEIV